MVQTRLLGKGSSGGKILVGFRGTADWGQLGALGSTRPSPTSDILPSNNSKGLLTDMTPAKRCKVKDNLVNQLISLNNKLNTPQSRFATQ